MFDVFFDRRGHVNGVLIADAKDLDHDRRLTVKTGRLIGLGKAIDHAGHIADQDDESTGGGVRSYAIDPDKADRLWSMSEKMVGESFAY